jgi:hypothetical protein
MGDWARPLRCLGLTGLLAFASSGLAQYTMDLTGVGDGAVAGGVYVSPYQGTISQNGKQLYAGYVICDDFNTNSYLDSPFSATETNANSLNGTEKFGNVQYTDPNGDGKLWSAGKVFTAAQDYDAVAWLANQLLANPSVNNPSSPVQAEYSFAIWDIFDGQTTGGTATSSLITAAFAAVLGGYQGSNVDVFTPSSQNLGGKNASQEFLVVNGPAIATPEPAAAGLLLFDLLSVLGIVLLVWRYRVRA